MKKWLRDFFYKLVALEPSAKRLTHSFCLGTFVALSPFIFFHTVLIIGLCWLLRLNLAVALLASTAISNPITVVFIKTFEYFLGYLLVHDMLGFDLMPYNPWWVDWINKKLEEYFHMHGIGLWYFLIGGMVVSVVATVIAYPILSRLFKKLERSYKAHLERKYEASCPK